MPPTCFPGPSAGQHIALLGRTVLLVSVVLLMREARDTHSVEASHTSRMATGTATFLSC